MSGNAYADRLKRKYFMRLLQQKVSLLRVIKEVQENLVQVEKEIEYLKGSEDWEYVADDRIVEKSFFHLEEQEKDGDYQKFVE